MTDAADFPADTLPELIARRAAATPDRVMLRDEHDRTVTFGEYGRAVEEQARTSSSRGVGPGAVVAWQLPTRVETLVLLGALSRIGATQVPILPMHRERELCFILNQTGAAWLCVPGTWRGVDYCSLAERVRADVPPFELILCDREPQPGSADRELPPAPEDGGATRWIYYSSGTTADPKGVRHSDATTMAAGRALVTAQGFEPEDRCGLAFPFTHIGGVLNLTAVLARGYSLSLVEVFDPEATAATFARHGVTVAGGGPAFIKAYLDVQRTQPGSPIFPELRFMTSGGAPMPPSMHDDVPREIGGRGCAQGYGLTETAGIIAMNHPADTDEHLRETVGRPVPGMEVRVVGARGETVPVGGEGELHVRGELVFAGYVDAALDHDAFSADGWLRTGDLGSVDANGYVRITGRLKDIIIRKGENISAREIEDLLYTHPAITEVAVIGVPDDERGEMVCAVVVATADAGTLRLDQVTRHLIECEVMPQKLPERLEVVTELPRNPTGKVLKQALVDRFAPRAPARQCYDGA